MGGDTQNWLRFYNCRKEVQYKEDFINSYYFAKVLANLQKDPLQIPESVFIEELIKDEQYKMDQITKSQIIQQFLFRLLQTVDTRNRITERNYESELHNYFERPGYLPQGAVNPLQNGSSFHSLSSKAKLWIILQLMTKAGPIDDPIKTAEDSHGNVYTLVDGGRLYVGFGKELGMVMKDDNERRTPHRSPFEHFLAKSEPGKLLAETEKEWKQMIALYDSYDEEEVSTKLKENIEKAKEMMVLTIEQKEQIRDEFNARMHPQKKMSSQENKNEAPPAYHEVVVKKKAVCWNWPDCPYGSKCHNHHPEFVCKYFLKSPKCPGFNCRFIHPVCPNDGNCTSFDCAYKHMKSEPTLRRRSRAGMRGNNPHEDRSRETTGNPQGNQRRSPSRGPAANRRQRSPSRGGYSDRANSPPRQEQRPSARNGGRYEDRSSRAQSRGAPRNTGRQRNQSRDSHTSRDTADIPPRHEHRPSARNDGRYEDQRSRAQSRGPRENARQRHQSRGSQAPRDTAPSETRNGHFNDNGNRPMNNNFNTIKTRCSYWPECNKSDDECRYTHPKEECTNFLQGLCMRGGYCEQLHGKCRDDGQCSDAKCEYDHYEQESHRLRQSRLSRNY